MATFVHDTFTDTSGISLSAHTGETGATWTRHPAYASFVAFISNANRARTNALNPVVYYASGAPATADYTVQASLALITALTGDLAGVVGRCDPTADTMYQARYQQTTGQWLLSKRVAGAATTLGTFTAALADGDLVELSMVGTTISLLVNGVSRITVVDAAIAAAGKAGVYLNGGSDTTGYHLDNFQAADAGAAPTNTAAPSISGTDQVGSTLTGSDGTWTNSPTSFTRQWYRDNHGGGTYSAISGATASTYTLVDADDGCQIEFGVIATNGSGSSSEARSSAVSILEAAPVNTNPPAVTGTTVVGDTLTCSQGSWQHMGGVVETFTFQWRRDNQGGGTFSDIAAATASTYTLVDADDGCKIECRVTATNDEAATSATSTAVGPTVEPAPVNTVAPAVTGTVRVGEMIGCSTGTWQHMGGLSPTYAFQWRSAPGPTPSVWTDIAGATDPTYTLAGSDLGLFIDCVVTANNSGTG